MGQRVVRKDIGVRSEAAALLVDLRAIHGLCAGYRQAGEDRVGARSGSGARNSATGAARNIAPERVQAHTGRVGVADVARAGAALTRGRNSAGLRVQLRT